MKEVAAYLNFDGTCREAVQFYQKCFGADLHITTFAETPMEFPAEAKNRVMHARLTRGTTILMAADTWPGQPFEPGNNFSMCIGPETIEETQRLFTALGEGGKVTMELQDTFWGAHFGTLTDRFGVNWMFNFERPKT